MLNFSGMPAGSVSSLHIAPQLAARRFVETLSGPVRLAIGVSGGSDSTGLLVALNEAIASSGRGDVSLVAATIDHALRPESAAEAIGVSSLCDSLQIPHFIRRWEGDKPLSGISAAAREARYRLLAGIADATGSDAIVLAHTHGDQLETMAMRAARSQRDDNAGLAGMAPLALYGGRHWILRPFLECDRLDIRAFLVERGLGWIDDPGNSNLKSERIRFRQGFQDAQPSMEPGWQAAATRRIRLAQHSAAAMAQHGQIHGGVLAALGRDVIDGDEAVTRHLLGVLVALMGGRSHMPASDTMDRATAFIRQWQPGRLSAGRAIIDIRREAVYIYRENRDIAPLIVAPGQKGLWDNRFTVENNGCDPVMVSAGGEITGEDFAGVPDGVLSRLAGAALPVLSTGPQQVIVKRYLAVFDLFLSGFDLALANRLAPMCGRTAYGAPAFCTP